MKPALLVIDVQKEFFKNDAFTVQSLNDAIEYINVAITMFRKHNLPVICVQHINEANGLLPGSEGFDLPDQLEILPDDLHIYKTYSNSFNKTALHQKLQEMGVDTLIITGYNAAFCVFATYNGARDLDYVPMMLRGGLASTKPEYIQFVQEISEIISYRALGKVLG